MLNSTSKVGINRIEPGRYLAPHSHGFEKVSLVIAGEVRERHGAIDATYGAGWFVSKPEGAIHEDWIGDRGLCTLTIRAKVAGAAQAAWATLTSDYSWSPIDAPVSRLLSLCQIEGEESDAVEEAVLALASARTRRESVSSDWYAKAVNILRSSVLSPPTIEQLSNEVAVHPVTLSREFTRRGTSKSEVVHSARMRKSLALLSRDMDQALIASELGYADVSHFSRTFKLFFGMTPGQYRFRFLANG